MSRIGTAGAVIRGRKRTFDNIMIEGDSITSLLPSTVEATKYSYRYASTRPDKTWNVRARQSRTSAGTLTSLAAIDDFSNSLYGHISEDVAYGPQLITYMIGTNDFGSAADTTVYRSNCVKLKQQYNRRGLKVVWGFPIALNPDGTASNYSNWMIRRAELSQPAGDARNPTVWAQYGDYYWPVGDYPDFGDATIAAANSLFGDNTHPSATGQLLLQASYTAFMDTLLQPGLVNSPRPDASVWPASQTNLATSQTIVDRFVVKGIAHGGLSSGISISGASAQIRLNGTDGFGGTYGTTFGTNSGNGYRIYNGDVVDVKVVTSASNNTAVSYNLTIGNETRTITKTTVIAVTPVSMTDLGIYTKNTNASTFTTPAVTFAAGQAQITCGAPAVSAVTILGAGAGGSNLSCTLPTGASVSGAASSWIATVPAGSFAVKVDYTTGFNQVVHIANVLGADPTPTAAVANAPNEADPHLLTAVTIPASGMLIAGFRETGTGSGITPAVTTNNGTFVVEGSCIGNSTSAGLVIAKCSTAGTFQQSWSQGFGTFRRVGLVWKALGT